MDHIRAIIFDVGGTIVEGAMPWHELYRRALEIIGHPASPREMVAAYESAMRRMVAGRQAARSADTARPATLNEHLAQALDLTHRRLVHAIDEVLFDHPEARHLVRADGALATLAGLRARGYRLGVISNWSADLPRVLKQLGLAVYFEAVFASEALGYAKPEAAAFLIPLERMGLTPGTSAYVGDLYDVDVVGARQVGMTPVLVDPLSVGLHPDTATVAHITELLRVFTGSGPAMG